MPRSTRPTSISFEDSLRTMIDQTAATLGMSRSQFIIHCVRQEMVSLRKGSTTVNTLPEDLQPKSRPGGRGGERKKWSKTRGK